MVSLFVLHLLVQSIFFLTIFTSNLYNLFFFSVGFEFSLVLFFSFLPVTYNFTISYFLSFCGSWYLIQIYFVYTWPPCVAKIIKHSMNTVLKHLIPILIAPPDCLLYSYQTITLNHYTCLTIILECILRFMFWCKPSFSK